MSATIEKMVLDYQTLKYKGIYGPNEYGTDPYLFFNGLIFCTAETSTQYTTIESAVLHKTGNGPGDGCAKLLFKFTPLFLLRKGDPNQEYPCERLDANHVLVRNVKFRKIDKINVLVDYDDDVPNWTDLPADHVTFFADDITLDLKYQEIYGENSKYYKLVSSTLNGTEITSDYFDDDTAATCWNNLFGEEEEFPNSSTGTEVGRFIRYASSTVGLTETYYKDVAFNQYAIGNLTEYEPGDIQRCECGEYPDGDASAPPTTDIAYIFDFSGVLYYDIDGLNQGYRIHSDIFVLTDPTKYNGDLKTFFESSAPMLEEVYDEHMVVAVDEENVTYVNFDNTGSYPRGFLKKLFLIPQIQTEPINYTDKALEDNKLMTDMLIIPLSDDYITPMEFYEETSDAVEVEFSSKLVAKTAADKTDIPTYFWVESLKNWCYYDMTTVNDACNIAMLKVWNGKDNWQFLDNLLESAKLRYIPRDEYTKLLAEYQNTSTVPARKAEIKDILSDFADHTLSQILVYPCNLDKLKTISIDRIYHGAKANYAGKPKDKGFLDYLYDATIGNVINAAVGTWYIISSPFSTHKFDKFKKGLGTIATGVLNAAAGTAMIFLALTPDLLSKFVYYGLDKFINSFSNISTFWRIDHYQTLFASCRYVILPYDNKYSNNDEVTFQTIRNHDRWDNVEGGIMTRERIIAYLSINTTIGSPFIARSSTGELMLATAFTYSGPVREKYDSATDLIKQPGIIADDIKLSNELLQKTLGNGYDKTIKDWLNFMGNTPDESLTPTVNVNNATAISKSVAELANTNQTAEASMLLTANRSKVSSDVENIVINTLKKW
jgi:hypothetical protein